MNREDWLNRVAERMAPWFARLDCPLPPFRVAIGFPSTGKRGKRIGECWDAEASADGTFEILIRPDLDDPVEVAAVLAHELTHAAVGLDQKHGPAFKRVATGVGLTGKMTATVPSEAFKRDIAPILAAVGELPHARLGFGASSAPPKQSTRMLKAECAECGYTVRLARKWAEIAAPVCPVDDHGPMTVHGLDEEAPADDDGAGVAEAA